MFKALPEGQLHVMYFLIHALLQFLMTKNFGKKKPILVRRKKNLSVILDKSIVTQPFSF
jgi:hypothetical protein